MSLTGNTKHGPSASFSLATLRRELGRLADDASVLIIGRESAVIDWPGRLSPEYLPVATTVPDLDGYGMYDLCVIFALAPAIAADDRAQLLGRLRDLHARRLLVMEPALPGTVLAEMLALGFERHTPEEGPGEAVYLYDVDRFNEKREWNSPEDWANPENFDKYRW